MTPRLRRIATGFVLFLGVVAAAVWLGSALVVSLNAGRIIALIEQSLGPGFEVGTVNGDIVRGLMLEGVAAGPDPAADPSGDPILQAARCRLSPDYLELLQGRLAIAQVHFSDVTLVLRRTSDGAMLWPPFIQRAATAQGAAFTMSAFGWHLERAEVTYYPTADARPLRAQIPDARGRFQPGGRFQIDTCTGTLNDATWELAASLDQSTKALSGIWRLRQAGIWTLTQALTGHRDMRLDAGALPTGTISGALNIGGTLSDPELRGKLDWREGSLRHFVIEQGELQLAWRPGKLTFEESVLKAYNGRLAAEGAVDFRAQPPHYVFTATTEQMELGAFLEDAGFGKLQLTGRYAGTLNGEGHLHDIASFRASGQVNATKGQTLNPLYDPTLDGSPRIVDYDSLTADITIQREQLRIRNGEMTGSDMRLTGGGQVDFDGALNLDATLTAPGRMFTHHPQFGPAVSYLQLQNEPIGLLLDVGGTLSVPDVAVTVDPASIQEAAKKGLFNKLRDFFQGSGEASGTPEAPTGQ